MSDAPETLDPLSFSPVDFITTRHRDTALLLDASLRWKEHRNVFNTLLAQAPGIYQALLDLVREQLGADPLSTALRFKISDTHHSDVSLVALAAHTRQYPQPPADLDQRAQLTGLSADHRLLRLTPTQLLAKLAQLDIPAAVRRQWDDYWYARASDTAVSRRSHALNQYLEVFRASWDVAVATGNFDAQQQRSVSGVLDNPEWLRHEGKPIAIRTLSIDGQVMPGALLFNIEDEPQLMLYRPGSTPNFSAYTSQSNLEEAIGSTASSFSYESHDSLSAGFAPLFNSLLNERLDALDNKPGADIQQFGELALALIHWVDTQQSDSSALSLAPAIEMPDSDAPQARSLYDFGNLSLDVPYPIRLQQITTQQALMDRLAETNLQSLKDYQQALEDACQQAEQAIEQQLQANTWACEQIPVASEDLLQAHYQGLRAHARFQNLLGEIDNEELRWLESLLDHPESFPRPGSSIVAAHPVLTSTSMDEGAETSTSTTLHDCLVVTLQNDDAPHSLLLYWPGEAGGLLRCANHDELARCFAVSAEDNQSLGLSPVTGDVLAQVLAHHFAQARIALAGAPSSAAVSETLAQRLNVPRQAAREYAFNLIQEQETSAALSNISPDWLAGLSDGDRQELKSGTLGFINAMYKAQALVALDLPHIDLFCRQLVSERLKLDFPEYDDSPITLHLPQSASWVRVVVDSTSPQGIATKLTLKPSSAWVDLTLENLLLENVDEAMRDRLSFLRLKLQTPDQTLAQQLTDGIDKTYLSDLARDLNLAQKYENKLSEVYRGTHESPFAQAYRRQCLGEPFRQMLKLQSAQARAKGELDDKGQTIFNIAIDADSAAAYQADGHDIRLFPARLTAGGEDTESYGTTLSGVTFICDEKSGVTVLYRPDHPTRLVHQYPSLKEARLALYDLSKQSGEIDYLASRALLGSPAAHASRIRQAIEHHFDGIIGLGTTWPLTTSLAQHLLDAQAGRRLEAHRATSRSNRDLWLENFAYQSGMVFNYIKMALGFIPVIGTVVSVYDFFDACAKGVRALLQDEVYKALEALEQALLAFVDAAIDLLPSLSFKALAARLLTRKRQLQLLHAGPTAGIGPVSASTARRLARFEGYEYQAPLSLAGIEPGRVGKYKGIYQHADGDFILVGDRPCQVQWLDTEHTWRLRGNRFKTWRKNIALNNNGRWDTHFALYGVHLRGGGAGGGQTLGRLADLADPLWPAPVRERLPRWWTDATYRRRLALKEATEHSYSRLVDQYAPLDKLKIQGSSDAAELARIDQACANEIAQAKVVFEQLDNYRALLTGRNLTENAGLKSSTVTIILQRSLNRVNHAKHRASALQDDINKLDTPIKSKEQYALFNQKLRQFIETMDHIEHLEKEIRKWLSHSIHSATINTVKKDLPNVLTFNHFANKTGELLKLVERHGLANDLTWQYFNDSVKQARNRFVHAANNHNNLHKISLASERKTILNHCIDAYEKHIVNLRVWSTNYPDYFESRFLPSLSTAIEELRQLAKKELAAAPKGQTATPKPGASGQSQARVFETEDAFLLIGSQIPAAGAQPQRFKVTGLGGIDEIYVKGARGKWHRESPPPASTTQFDPQQLIGEAQQRLNAIDHDASRISNNIKPGSIPADLEDLMSELAAQLRSRAQRIESLGTQQLLVTRLREKATRLVEQGKLLRTAQTLVSQKPNAGQLDYLVEQGAVDIRKKGGPIELTRRQDGRRDFLQEYEIRDLSQNPPQPLWYAHFHYTSAKAEFDQFAKAHLKLSDYRYLGAKWQQSLGAGAEAIWRGDINQTIAAKHFQAL
ncbi:dermonecrotic toxin domain-containing protein [Pseudomonas sp. 2835]|uniref:dermonecrotic toxin domain-containing protein n=1 Tax=Pseudomonas sp. 2835 TaxID=3156451 RepID=UPI003D1A06F1